MLKQESNDIGSGENSRAQACDSCRSTPCTVYCHADSAYLCTSCDAQVHSANRVASRHKRVQVCESCECAPAAFLCEANKVAKGWCTLALFQKSKVSQIDSHSHEN